MPIDLGRAPAGHVESWFERAGIAQHGDEELRRLPAGQDPSAGPQSTTYTAG
jgi:hypothetical protein